MLRLLPLPDFRAGACACVARTAGLLLPFVAPVSAAAQNVPPEALAAFPALLLDQGGAAHVLPLADHFRDPDVPGPAVRLTFRIGAVSKPVDIALFADTAPATVANFLAYVDAGRFAANILHRSVPGFVLQSGGFFFPNDTTFDYVPTFSPVVNEFQRSNTRGTLAMAKVGGDPNSATSQWFINLANNSANLDAQNGGFTVFARVLGNGMAVADEIAALPTYNASSLAGAWTNLPLKNYDGSLRRSQFVESSAARIAPLTYTATAADPSLVAVALTDGALTLTPAADRAGSTSVTLTATDLEGAQAQAVFTVTVRATYAAWRTAAGLAPAAEVSPSADADADGWPDLLEWALGGQPAAADRPSGAPWVSADRALHLTARRAIAARTIVESSADLVQWTERWRSEDGTTAAIVIASEPAGGADGAGANNGSASADVLTFSVPEAAGSARWFWRVRVETLTAE